MSKLKLKEKERLNEQVSNETIRCLSIFKSYEDQRGEKNNGPLFKECIKQFLGDSPYVKFNDDLQRELKKVG